MRKNTPLLHWQCCGACLVKQMRNKKDIQKDEHDIETLVINASPLKRTVLESSTPVTIISGEELDQNQPPL